MRKYSKYLLAGVAVAGFLVGFSLAKIPVKAIKMFSTIGRTFKQVLLKDRSYSPSGYDVITSASIRVDNSSREKS